jgi:hypothetical protein
MLFLTVVDLIPHFSYLFSSQNMTQGVIVIGFFATFIAVVVILVLEGESLVNARLESYVYLPSESSHAKNFCRSQLGRTNKFFRRSYLARLSSPPVVDSSDTVALPSASLSGIRVWGSSLDLKE